jgi:peptide/nickel transport system permease protein
MSSLEQNVATGSEHRSRRPLRELVRGLLSALEGRIGIVILACLALVVIVGPSLAPYPPNELGTGLPSAPPSSAHLLGTDSLGRDILSRVLCGGRSVLGVPLLATVIAFVIGGLIGISAAYRGGTLDLLTSRAWDLLLAFPPLLLVLVIVAGLGTSARVLAISIAVVFIPRNARVLRGAAQGVISEDYVVAARARGERSLTIVVREVLPNIAGPAFVEFALRLTFAVIFVASLNFLGLGEQPPSPNWGLMVSENRSIIRENPWATLAPALMIGLLAMSVSLISDAATRVVSHRAKDET